MWFIQSLNFIPRVSRAEKAEVTVLLLSNTCPTPKTLRIHPSVKLPLFGGFHPANNLVIKGCCVTSSCCKLNLACGGQMDPLKSDSQPYWLLIVVGFLDPSNRISPVLLLLSPCMAHSRRCLGWNKQNTSHKVSSLFSIQLHLNVAWP